MLHDEEYDRWFRREVLKKVFIPLVAVTAIGGYLWYNHLANKDKALEQIVDTTYTVPEHVRDIYVTHKGESVKSLLRHTHTVLDSLKVYNPGYNFKHIMAGDTLYIER